MWKSGKNSRAGESGSRGGESRPVRNPEYLNAPRLSVEPALPPQYERPSRIINTQYGVPGEFMRMGTPSLPRFERELEGSLQRSSLISRPDIMPVPAHGRQSRERDDMIRSLFGTEERYFPESSRVTPMRPNFSQEKNYRESLTTDRGATLTPNQRPSQTISMSRERVTQHVRNLFPTETAQQDPSPNPLRRSRPRFSSANTKKAFTVWEDWMLLSSVRGRSKTFSVRHCLALMHHKNILPGRSLDTLRKRWSRILRFVRRDQFQVLAEAAQVASKSLSDITTGFCLLCRGEQ